MVNVFFFCTAKRIVNCILKWEKVFASYTSERRPISRICKEQKQINIKKTNNQVKGQALELNNEFLEQEILMTRKHLNSVQQLCTSGTIN